LTRLHNLNREAKWTLKDAACDLDWIILAQEKSLLLKWTLEDAPWNLDWILLAQAKSK